MARKKNECGYNNTHDIWKVKLLLTSWSTTAKDAGNLTPIPGTIAIMRAIELASPSQTQNRNIPL